SPTRRRRLSSLASCRRMRNDTLVGRALATPSARKPAIARSDQIHLSDLNLAEFIRHQTRYGGTVLEEEGLLLFAGEHAQPGPYRNGALRLDDRLSATEALNRARRFFAVRRRSFVLWVRAHSDGDLDELARRLD